MNAGNIFFLFCSFICVIGAIWTVIAKSPIRSAVGLLTTIVGIAGLFLQLRAQFLAAIQLIVYAGAVVVLFVFVIMLLGTDAGNAPAEPTKSRFSRALSVVLMAGLALAAVGLVAGVSEQPQVFGPARTEHGSIEAVGGLLFSKGIVPFELSTALLIVAVIGAIGVARSRPSKKKLVAVQHETKRLFGGPLHPRDAGHPLTKEKVG
jgi:NADH-quinone oxidoreductase subunit J